MSVNDDFHDDSRPLLAGDVIGVRSFAVDKLGRLTGVSHRKVWRPGVNTATCPHARARVKAADAVEAEREGRRDEPGDWSAAMRSAITRSMNRQILSGYLTSIAWGESAIRTDEHKPGAKGCSCGYWAYFDGSDDFSSDGTVTGVVRGEGVVTIGSKGFRAERAELLALVAPANPKKPSLWHRWMDWLADADGALASALVVGASGLALFTVAAVLDAVAGSALAFAWALAAVLSGGLLASGVVAWNNDCHSDHDEPRPAVAWDAVRRNYPDVPVYPTLKAALRDHPLSTPPAPEPLTPENTPDFWEREAS